MEQKFKMLDATERLMFLMYNGKAADQRLLGPFNRADKLCLRSGASLVGQLNISAYVREREKLGELDVAHQKLLGKLKTLSISQANSPAVRLLQLDDCQVEQYIKSATRLLLRVTDHSPSICDVNANPETILARWKYEGNPPVDALFGAAVWLFGTLLQTLIPTWGILADYMSLKVYLTHLVSRDTLTKVQTKLILDDYHQFLTGTLMNVEDVLQTWCQDAQQWRILVHRHFDQPIVDLYLENESVWQKTVKILHKCEELGQRLFAFPNTGMPKMKEIAGLYWDQRTFMTDGINYLLEFMRETVLSSGNLQFFQIPDSNYDVDSTIKNASRVVDGLSEFSITLFRSDL